MKLIAERGGYSSATTAERDNVFDVEAVFVTSASQQMLPSTATTTTSECHILRDVKAIVAYMALVAGRGLAST